MGIMKFAMFLVATTLLWATLFPGLVHAILTWDLTSTSATSYENFIADLRKQSKDPKLTYFNIPMLSGSSNPKYLLVGLQVGASTITIAISSSDLYVMGYSDMIDGKERAHFFQDTPKDAKDKLFPNAKGDKYRLIMSYKSSYQDIESKAGVKDRKNFKLGVQKLAKWVPKVYGKAVTEKNFVKSQAEMLLMAVQMVCEATRFSYIEKQVKTNWGDFEFTPDYKFIRLENRWGKLSTAIRVADPKTKKFKSKVDLVTPDNTPDNVENVDQVKDDIALLKYVK